MKTFVFFFFKILIKSSTFEFLKSDTFSLYVAPKIVIFKFFLILVLLKIEIFFDIKLTNDSLIDLHEVINLGLKLAFLL